MDRAKEKQLIDAIDHSLGSLDLGDIKAIKNATLGVDLTMAGFILCVCFIEHVCSFMYGGKKKIGSLEFQGFIKKYLPPEYDAKTIREELRDCLVHHYTLGECYLLTRHRHDRHLKPDSDSGRVFLDLDTFIEDLEAGYGKYIDDVKNKRDELWNKAVKAFNTPRGPGKEKRGVLSYFRPGGH